MTLAARPGAPAAGSGQVWPAEAVLLCTPTGRDSELMRQSLSHAGRTVRVVRDIPGICLGIAAEGGVAVVAEEALHRGGTERLLAALERQPSWSDFPLVVLTSPLGSGRVFPTALESLRRRANVALLERPVHPLTLLSAVDSALRARRRQYEVRDYLAEREAAEDRIRQAQKMDAVGQLAGGVAHEVNNMMTAVIGFGELVLRRLAAESGIRPDIEEMVKAGKRAASITQQLLAFSRRQRREPVVLAVDRVLADLSPLLHRLLGASVDLDIQIPPDLPNIRMDRNQLEQVLVNLALNARDAMPDGGRVTITAEVVRLGEEWVRRHGLGGVNRVRFLQIGIGDDGCGMERTTRERAFEPFFTTKATGKGTGLGLATVYGIVKQSDGYIWLYSEPGLGTTVKLYFPEFGGTPTDDAEPVPPSTRGRETILVVEDEPVVRRLARAALETHGYQVVEAEHGEQALAELELATRTIALVLTDTVMPRLNGRELAERLADSRPELPILFMSGYPGQDVAERGLLHDGVPFIQKPFTPEGLVRTIRRMLDGS